METLKSLDHHIDTSPGVIGGKPRITGRRIAVQDIVIWHELMGISVDEIASEYNLTLGNIYAALAWYHDHKDEIDLSLKKSDKFVKSYKKRRSSKISLKSHE
ncbi:DUF433 domain-containing protein [bacterium]|nr:DUF433 domain-containing protein [bacterium]